MFGRIGLHAGQYALGRKHVAQKLHRVPLQRHPRHLVIRRNMFADGHHRQGYFWFLCQFARIGGCEQGQLIRRSAPRFPPARTPVKIKRAQGIGIRQQMQGARRQSGLARQLLQRSKGSCGRNRHCPILVKPADLPQAKPQGTRLDFIIPSAEIHINRADINLMIARILHKLGWRVKTHGLRIQQCRRKNRWMMAFQP